MDIKCPRCFEPWDMDELHEVEGMTFAEAYRAFGLKGCEVFGTQHGDMEPTPRTAQQAAQLSAIYDLLGDDADGAAAMIEDMGL